MPKAKDQTTEELEDEELDEEELEDEDDSSEDDDSTDDEDDDSDENDNDPLLKLSKSELIYRVQKGERDTAKANRQAAKRRIELRDLKAEKSDDEDEDDTPNEEMDSLKVENQKLQTKILRLDASTKLGKTEITVEGKKYQIIDSDDILIESEEDLEDIDGLLQDAFRLKPHFFAPVEPEKEEKEKTPGSPKGKQKRKKGKSKSIKFNRHHL